MRSKNYFGFGNRFRNFSIFSGGSLVFFAWFRIKTFNLFDFKFVLSDRNIYPIKKDGHRLKEIDIEIKSDTTIAIDVFEWKKLKLK